ncbi:hypothetical protein C0Q70_04064 [Pomacea canaliculata]|uniref:Uncharacterized protein n=1 Tax=Pomacea canaliculata TaxID=400727 RepID=A0A2T7PUH5_POMCA|nr:hypothetical protein C0Q70_04064 [Pomacea canaliculata]
MYPNATHGYMPFVKPAHKRQAAKRSKAEKDSLKSKTADGTKTYKVTMRDRRGFTYTYIIQADASKSLPVLCESRVTAPSSTLLSNSLPNMRGSARFPVSTSRPESRSCASLADGKDDLSKSEEGEKKGLFNSLLQFIRKKTASKSSKNSAANTKSKRKLKPLPQRKRQRTVSAMSNLDPIQESPEEDNLDDTDSYSHDSVSSGTESDSGSGDGHGSCP